MSSDLTGMTILVVDDEALIAFDLETMLVGAGARVLGPAHSEAQAMAAINAAVARAGEAAPFDGAVLDLHLGKGTSEAVGIRLTALGVPFLVHSGQARIGDPVVDRIAAPLLRKPASETALVEALAAMVRIPNH